jgi:sugar phosphate isomerase/epimerase
MTNLAYSTWQFGCQARPWIQTLGMPNFRDELPVIMQQIAGIGFTGFETALPALPLEDPQTFADWRSRADSLQLAAAHAGGNWWEPEIAASVPRLLDRIACLPILGCERLMVSIGADVTTLDTEELGQMFATLNSLGEGAAKHGVEVAIHNHAHELQNDARVLHALLESTNPDHLSLGADIGWVVYSGWDPIAFLDTFGNRLSYLHVRDVRTEGERTGFIEVGRGSMDWGAFTTKLRQIGFVGWLTAESEFSDYWLGIADPQETATAQFQGMSMNFLPPSC